MRRLGIEVLALLMAVSIAGVGMAKAAPEIEMIPVKGGCSRWETPLATGLCMKSRCMRSA